MRVLGKLSIVDLTGCDRALIDDLEHVQKELTEASIHCGATIVKATFHAFAPQGITGILAISESHISIHTWPEHDFATVDVFCCNGSINVDLLSKMLKTSFKAKEIHIRSIDRGII